MGHDLAGEQPCLVSVDRITRLPHVDLFVGAVLEAHDLHAVMVVVAVGLGLDERRAMSRPGPVDRLGRRFVDGDGVHAVDHHARHAVARGAVDDIVDCHRDVARRVLAVLVVLADEHGR